MTLFPCPSCVANGVCDRGKLLYDHDRPVTKFLAACSLPKTMPAQTFDDRRLVGVHAERVTDVSSRDFPGHFPDEDHSWNLAKFKEVRLISFARDFHPINVLRKGRN